MNAKLLLLALGALLTRLAVAQKATQNGTYMNPILDVEGADP